VDEGRAEPQSATTCDRAIAMPLTKSDPHEEHDLPLGKKNAGGIIHAEGVRFACPSPAPQAPKRLRLRKRRTGTIPGILDAKDGSVIGQFPQWKSDRIIHTRFFRKGHDGSTRLHAPSRCQTNRLVP
jgi:hypothetical protein